MPIPTSQPPALTPQTPPLLLPLPPSNPLIPPLFPQFKDGLFDLLLLERPTISCVLNACGPVGPGGRRQIVGQRESGDWRDGGGGGQSRRSCCWGCCWSHWTGLDAAAERPEGATPPARAGAGRETDEARGTTGQARGATVRAAEADGREAAGDDGGADQRAAQTGGQVGGASGLRVISAVNVCTQRVADCMVLFSARVGRREACSGSAVHSCGIVHSSQVPPGAEQ
ncbi:hypothetical protein ON010_g765 [Phytophthora cinnamomi]|nr:hypothetical protein ON010_g765 [Phytophthora cinnamomi]